MKKTVLTVGLVLSAAFAVFAQNVIYTFDENGNSSPVLQSRLFLDNNPDGNGPAGGITTLDYLYPIDGNNDHLQLGWVVITDPNDGISDLIRFDSSTQVGSAYYQQIFFYSNDHDGDLADNFPGSVVVNQILGGVVSGNTVIIQEDANGNASYTPLSSTAPGFHFIGSNAGTPFSYVFISAVPEPSALWGAIGALALVGRALRRNQKN